MNGASPENTPIKVVGTQIDSMIDALKKDINSLEKRAPLIDLINLLKTDISNLTNNPSSKYAFIVLTTIENLQAQIICLENISDSASLNQPSISQLKPLDFCNSTSVPVKALNSTDQDNPGFIFV